MHRKFLLGFMVLMLGRNVFGQDMERKFTVQADPLLFVWDVFALGMWDDDAKFFCMDVEGQYKLNNTFSLSLSLSFLINNIISTIDYVGGYYGHDYFQEDIFQIDLEPMVIYRPFRTGAQGFFLGLYPTIGLQSVKLRNETPLYTELGLGFAIGYKWILNNGFTIQLGGGVCKVWSIPEKPRYFLNSDLRIPLRNFELSLLDFKIGYSF
jgi:hypothetical protein